MLNFLTLVFSSSLVCCKGEFGVGACTHSAAAAAADDDNDDDDDM